MALTALLIIDVQKGLDDPIHGKRSTPEAETNIARLLAHWRSHGRPIIHVRHDSVEPHSLLRPGLPGNEVKEEARPLPGEKQFTKHTNSAFVGTGLADHLHHQGITSLVIVGLTTDHCVSTTARAASDLGLDVTLVADATAAHEKRGFDGVHYPAETIHHVNLVSLEGEFCTVRQTHDILDIGRTKEGR